MRQQGALLWITVGAAVFALLLAASGGMGAPAFSDPVLEEAIGGRAQAVELRSEVQSLEKQVSQQQKRIQQLRTATASLQQKADAIAAEEEGLNTGAGYTALVGPGVEIRLSDAPLERVKDSGPNYDINWFLVHDRDVLRVLNLLKAAGAEALAVNGVRLDTGTAVHCGGPAIYLRDIALTPPFLISAIGDPSAMTLAIKGPPEGPPSDVYLELASYGLVFDMKESGQVHIPSIHSTQAAGNASRAAR